MRGTRVAVMSLLLLLSSAVVVAQRCEAFAGEPQLCRGLIDYSVWVPPGLSQSNLSDALLASGVYATALLPGECARTAAIAACSATFRSCGTDDLPLPLCLDYCVSAPATQCGLDALLNCSATDPILAPAPLWEAYTNRTGTPEDCALAYCGVPQIDCPLPFIWNARDDSCTMKCPPIGLDDKRPNDISYWFSRVFGAISVAMSVLASIVAYREYISSTATDTTGLRRLARFAVFNLWIASIEGWLGDILPKWWSTWEHDICLDQWTVRDTSSTSCFFTSITGYHGRIAHAYWVFVLVYTIIMLLPKFHVLSLPLRNSDRFPLFPGTVRLAILVWGISSLQWLLGVSKGWFNANVGASACTIDPSLDDGRMNLHMVLLPLTVTCSLSSIMMVAFSLYLIRKGLNLAKSQWRLLMVSGIYLTCIWVILSFTWFAYHKRHEIGDRITYAILASAMSGGAINYKSVYHSPINVGWLLFVSAVTSLVPALMSIPFINSYFINFYGDLLSKGSCAVTTSDTADATNISPEPSRSHMTNSSM